MLVLLYYTILLLHTLLFAAAKGIIILCSAWRPNATWLLWPSTESYYLCC